MDSEEPGRSSRPTRPDDRRPDRERPPGHNEVHLVGRVAAPPVSRSLPSGDVLVTWRVVVERPAAVVRRGESPPVSRGPTVDTVDCVAWRRAVQRSALAWSGGETVDLEGALRRRFWRGAGGVASRCEVEVTRVRRLATPGAGVRSRRPAAAGPGPSGASG